MMRSSWFLLVCSAVACGGTTTAPPTADASSDAAAQGDGASPTDTTPQNDAMATGDTATGDAATNDAATNDAATGDAATGDASSGGFMPWTPDTPSPMTPIEAPSETWTWVPFPDSRCGNGSPAGIGVNLTTRSTRVLIFFMGGGGCWDALTCHLLNTAAHLNEDYNESVFRQEVGGLNSLLIFNRADTRNPFRDASYVFVPYCTGDIHGGNNVMTYNVGGAARTTYHVGARNMQSYLARLVRTFPRPDRVWVSGTSAGGYGAGIHWQRVQDAFPMARVDLLDDSGPPINPPATRFNLMKNAWNLQFPAGCTNCADDLSALMPYYRERFPPPHRMGLLSYTQDSTISTYFGITGAMFQTQLNALMTTGFDPTPNFRYFTATGTQHTMVGSIGRATTMGTALLDWVTAFATDSSTWSSVRPM